MACRQREQGPASKSDAGKQPTNTQSHKGQYSQRARLRKNGMSLCRKHEHSNGLNPHQQSNVYASTRMPPRPADSPTPQSAEAAQRETSKNAARVGVSANGTLRTLPAPVLHKSSRTQTAIHRSSVLLAILRQWLQLLARVLVLQLLTRGTQKHREGKQCIHHVHHPKICCERQRTINTSAHLRFVSALRQRRATRPART